MTTANTVNLANNPILDERLLPANIFATGAGHANPSRANDPGLVYDTQFKDYLPYLCGLNYTNAQVSNLLQRVSMIVTPSTLNFSKLNQNLEYIVTFSIRANSSNSGGVQGFLKWTNNRHSVRSPIAIVLDTERLDF
ncbi:hypothetical protein T459_03993 [Capsicum annuum]|uniref:Subtilisin-like protease fibronectin type-III domain-containing protein n=1 Tax=Capsicum annuum TaxID=4072 RepID=A0A2G3APE9_CAPAN|nr:hypothetical protein T459_03993 [Capsicum annuum]